MPLFRRAVQRGASDLMVRAGLSMLGQGKEVTEKAMEDVMAKEIATMNTRIYYLNLIGVVTRC